MLSGWAVGPPDALKLRGAHDLETEPRLPGGRQGPSEELQSYRSGLLPSRDTPNNRKTRSGQLLVSALSRACESQFYEPAIKNR